jgi:endonuclease-8
MRPGRPRRSAIVGNVPEGDTVHHAARRLRAVLAGRLPQEIRTPQGRHRLERWPERLEGAAVRSVDAYGKHLFIRFDAGLTIHSHLRMTGSWRVLGEGEPWRRSPRRAWLVIRCDGREAIQFDGPVLELASDAHVRMDPRLARLGPDILAERFDEAGFLRRLRRDDPRRPIGDALLDQRTLAGVGNLWKAEACFATRLDPWRPLGRVADEEALAAVAFARERMLQSARDGFEARPRAVYGRAGRPCPRCGEPISSGGQWEDNRTTYWCPACQA